MEQKKSPATKKTSKKTSKRLLLADDSMTIQKVVNLTFAGEGIEVVAVGDGNALMEKFVETTPDLVLLDVNMPGADGYKICEIIKHDDETKHIPVILLVGSFEPFDETEARRVGADDFLKKPFQSISQLVAKVSALLDPNLRASAPSSFNDDNANNDADDEKLFAVREEDAETSQNADARIFGASGIFEPTENFAKTDSSLVEHSSETIGLRGGEKTPYFSSDSRKATERTNGDEIRFKLSAAGDRQKDFGGDATESTGVSPELVERIASRVAEKLSDRIVEEITSRIAPQISELIALELTREKIGKDN